MHVFLNPGDYTSPAKCVVAHVFVQINAGNTQAEHAKEQGHGSTCSRFGASLKWRNPRLGDMCAKAHYVAKSKLLSA